MENEGKNPFDQQSNDLTGQNTSATIRKIQNFLTAAAILCPVSLFFPGGIFFSTAGIVCSSIAIRRTLKLAKIDPVLGSRLIRIRTMSFVCLALSIVTFALNAIAILIVYPIAMEALRTGDLSGLSDILGSSSASPERSSTWG